MRQPQRAGRTRLTAVQRRESILTAAVEVFATAGYRAAKMSDIAARVGVTEPVIFQNFGSKAALFAAVVDRVSGDLRAELGTLTARLGSAKDLLGHMLEPGHAWPHVPGSHGVLFADAVSLAAEPHLSEPAARAARSIAGHLADVIRRGQADGDLRPDLDPEAASWLVLAVLSTQGFRRTVARHPGLVEADVAALVLRTLASPRPSPGAGMAPV